MVVAPLTLRIIPLFAQRRKPIAQRGAPRRAAVTMAAMSSGGPVVITGEGRQLVPGAVSQPLRAELHEAHFSLAVGGSAPISTAYRDLTTLVVQPGQVLLELRAGAARYVAERLGDRLATLVGELHERRARQLLTDRLIELPATERLEMVEYRSPDEHGVALLAFHDWGVALSPLDERRPWRLIRRADVSRVEAQPASGSVTVGVSGRPGAGAPAPIELLGLGASAVRQGARWSGLRERALADSAHILGGLLPAAPAVVQRAAGLLIDGRPVAPAELGDAWPQVQSAVLAEPAFAATYRELAARGGESWIALAPRRPSAVGATGELDPTAAPPAPVAWFLVTLPGNLLAMEIVTEGAHATYLFRVLPRAEYHGQRPAMLADAAGVAVYDVAEALIDGRFLREPIYLPADRLAEPRYERYRLAVAALPSLRAARARFVGRLFHRDEAGWSRSLEDAIAWHAAARDDAARWPGAAADDTTADDPGPTSDAQPTEAP
jgi:hypothetical protein